MTTDDGGARSRRPWSAIVLAVLCGAAVAGSHSARPDQPLREERHVPRAEAPPEDSPDHGADGGTRPTAAPPPTTSRTEPGGEVVTVPAAAAGSIPAVVYEAYLRAAARVGSEQPGCHLPVPLLAAIGKVESGHARGGQVDAAGVTLRPILGPTLDGGPGLASIADTDGGRFDGDTRWDRAVGPMQFIPGTWVRWARGGDPHNVHDAAVTAGRYLCADGRDLATPDGLREAVLSYNRSAAYLRIVSTWLAIYQHGTLVLPATGTDVGGGGPGTSAPLPVPPEAPPTQDVPAPPPAAAAPPPPATNPPTGTADPTTPPPPPPSVVTDPVTGLVCLVDGVLDLGGALLGGLLGAPPAPSDDCGS